MNKHRLKENIVAIVEQTTGIPFVHMRGDFRHEKIKNARHLLCYLLRVKANMTVKEIGTYISRDHSTVSHSLKRINGLIDVGDEKVIKDLVTINSLWNEIEGKPKIQSVLTTHYTEEYTISIPYPNLFPNVVKLEGSQGQSAVFDIEALNKAVREMGVLISAK